MANVIGSGYEDPRNLNLQASQYFLTKSKLALREAKKTLRRHNQSGGFIHPHEY